MASLGKALGSSLQLTLALSLSTNISLLIKAPTHTHMLTSLQIMRNLVEALKSCQCLLSH